MAQVEKGVSNNPVPAAQDGTAVDLVDDRRLVEDRLTAKKPETKVIDLIKIEVVRLVFGRAAYARHQMLEYAHN